MKALLKSFALLVVLAIAAPVAAQYYNHPVPPMVLCNGGYIPQGTPCGGYGGGMGVPMGIPMGAVGGLSSCEAIGGIAGATIGSLAKNNTVQAVILGGLAGGIAGNMLCRTSAGQVVSARQYQQGIQQQGSGSVQRVPARCDFDNGVTAYTYEGQTGCDKIAAKMTQRVSPMTTEVGQLQTVAQQQVASAETRFCKQGAQWKRLNWEGHPQHGKGVCLPEGDSHHFEGE